MTTYVRAEPAAWLRLDGVESYLGSLIAQRDMYDAQRALIVTRLAGAVNLVQLYQALGGGWKE